MKRSLMLILLSAAGCAPYSQVQIDLLNESRKGIELARQSLNEKSAVVSTYHALQRKRLDDAFDADVSDRNEFSADWIIEHPETSAVFHELGIDYSCGGKSLEYACQEQRLDARVVLDKLRRSIEAAGSNTQP